MTDIPHFDLPFRFSNGAAVVVEQDTTDDVVACVYAILVCPLGYRAELPEFGTDDPTFTEGAPDAAAIADTIARWEPRADTLISSSRDTVDELISYVSIHLATRSAD
jgi:phage baseplate assembly protein W